VGERSPMLQVEALCVRVAGRSVLDGITLRIAPGETHVLFGPNGSGKTSLLMAIMGVPKYEIVGGRILHNGEDITHLPADERARRGIGLVYQRPPTIRGVQLRQLAEICAGTRDGAEVGRLAQELHVEGLLGRDVNDGFSGGEIKKAELLQLLAQRPALALIDEPDAGVDLDNVALVVQAIKDLLEPQTPAAVRPACLIITHTGHILNYIRADVGHVLIGGRLVGESDPRRLIEAIGQHGYGHCPICRSQVTLP
jgi:Fe-S cluster assembly ATP-binding protein